MSAKLVAARALLKVFLVAALVVAVGGFGLQCSPCTLPVYRPMPQRCCSIVAAAAGMRVNIMYDLRKCLTISGNRCEGASSLVRTAQDSKGLGEGKTSATESGSVV